MTDRSRNDAERSHRPSQGHHGGLAPQRGRQHASKSIIGFRPVTLAPGWRIHRAVCDVCVWFSSVLKNCWDTLWKGGASAPPFRGSKFHSSVTCLGESRKSSRTPLRRGPEVWTFGNHEATVLHQGSAFYRRMTVRPARLAEVRHRSRGTSLEPASHTATSVGIPTHVHGAHPEGSQTSQANVRSTRLPADVRVITSKGEPRHCIDSEHKYLTPVAVLSRQS